MAQESKNRAGLLPLARFLIVHVQGRGPLMLATKVYLAQLAKMSESFCAKDFGICHANDTYLFFHHGEGRF